MRSKQPSIYQQALKEIRRLERAARRVEKRGYTFDLPFRRTRTGKEKTRFTKKELEFLKGIKTKDLYQYSTYQGKSGAERRAEERREASRKAFETKRRREEARKRYFTEPPQSRYNLPSISGTMIQDFLNRQNFSQQLYEGYYEQVVSFIQNVRSEYGDNFVGECLQEAEKQGVVTEVHRYYDEKFIVAFIKLQKIFWDAERLNFPIPPDTPYEDEYDGELTDSKIAEIFNQ